MMVDSNRRKRWYARDVVLLIGFVVSYAALFGALHALSFILGLQRKPSLVFAGVLPIVVLLIVVPLLALVVRMARTWPACIPDKRWRRRLRLLMVVGIIIFLVLPFTRFGFPPYKTYTAGFRRYVKANVDLGAMRAWLSTLDRKWCSDYVYDLTSGATIESWWPETAPWAKATTPLNPHSAMLLLDGDGHPAMAITWLGLFSHWGLVVGSEEMRVPPAGFVKYKEYRLPLDSGAYVWHEQGGLWRFVSY